MNIEPETIRILVDADACPVKAEIYRVAERHNLPVMLVANSFIAIPHRTDAFTPKAPSATRWRRAI